MIDQTKARPLYRKLALGMAVACLILALVFGILSTEGRVPVDAVCLFVGFVMLTIAQTGYWPPPRKK